MDKISDLKKIIIQTLDINKALDIVSIDLKDKSSIADYLVKDCLKNGLILFWLLWEKKAVRITPPLTIENNQIKLGCQIILNTLNKYQSKFVN